MQLNGIQLHYKVGSGRKSSYEFKWFMQLTNMQMMFVNRQKLGPASCDAIKSMHLICIYMKCSFILFSYSVCVCVYFKRNANNDELSGRDQ